MHRKRLYPVAKATQTICKHLQLSEERILRRAGLPVDLLLNEGKGVDAASYFSLLDAIIVEADDPDFIFNTAKAYAKGPFIPPLFAFSCSPNIREGLKRLAIFKPLVGPIRLDVENDDENLTFSLASVEADVNIPDSLCLWELVYFVESCRTFTGAEIEPVALSSPYLPSDADRYDAYFGVGVTKADKLSVSLSKEDAERPLISENAELWAFFEKELQKQLLESERSTLMSIRVRNALLELLPAGHSGIEAVCEKLMVGKRTLQRQLRAEGFSFQQILDETRSELSMHYLKQDNISIQEISYLLAYQEPNSFYRAFQNWTGMTPAEARGQSIH